MKKFNWKKRIKFTTGFTLVETLVAISILMVAVASPMSIAQQGLASSILSKDQMIATFLAQDAIEYIKNKRDEIGLNKIPEAGYTSTSWLGDGNSQLALSDLYNNCVISSAHPSVTSCNIDTIAGTTIANNLLPLNIIRDGSENLLYYGFGGTEHSKFTRSIQILPTDSNPNEALITINVSWNSMIGPQTVVLKNYVYNYWENL